MKRRTLIEVLECADTNSWLIDVPKENKVPINIGATANPSSINALDDKMVFSAGKENTFEDVLAEGDREKFVWRALERLVHQNCI